MSLAALFGLVVLSLALWAGIIWAASAIGVTWAAAALFGLTLVAIATNLRNRIQN